MLYDYMYVYVIDDRYSLFKTYFGYQEIPGGINISPVHVYSF